MLPILLCAALVLVVECYLLGRRGVFPILLALLFALFITGFHRYEYVGAQNFYLGPFNLYPLLCWTAGLSVLKIAYEHMPVRNKFFLVSALYVGTLFALEYIAYYWLGIRAAGNYPSLWGLGIIHGPPLIHWFYVLAGPAYLAILKTVPLRRFVGVKMPTARP